MQTNVVYSLENSFTLATNQVMVGIVSFLPNILGAVGIF
ncbi:MAG: hypothetical protein UW68_C0007G0006 [Candidatus Collierbacteria bacterium GW2011_GWB1_44_6]|uniref:Uncharacterized protein n=1 Tax=Candidatus Collierbacteria bacterium GW2011_GWB1_44_6 TaxID=1618384 RepID=A0A0G1JPP9_9BACT|nr:MAG: hypothetical protein UW68_C0007G0006 [Candidatus Collierbacteria bacterium GW2011_GWB1_44_6]